MNALTLIPAMRQCAQLRSAEWPVPTTLLPLADRPPPGIPPHWFTNEGHTAYREDCEYAELISGNLGLIDQMHACAKAHGEWTGVILVFWNHQEGDSTNSCGAQHLTVFCHPAIARNATRIATIRLPPAGELCG